MLASFETRIPAPIVTLIVAALMWLVAQEPPGPGASDPVWQTLGTAALQLSAVLALAAMATFWRVRTSINPMKPERASTLVTHGIYRFSRNPMYLSLLLLLVGYAIRLWSLPAAAGPALFAAYVTRFQIAPEERALEAKFGAAFTDYKRRVRRWL